jgi:hypothetical protein
MLFDSLRGCQLQVEVDEIDIDVSRFIRGGKLRHRLIATLDRSHIGIIRPINLALQSPEKGKSTPPQTIAFGEVVVTTARLAQSKKQARRPHHNQHAMAVDLACKFHNTSPPQSV